MSSLKSTVHAIEVATALQNETLDNTGDAETVQQAAITDQVGNKRETSTQNPRQQEAAYDVGYNASIRHRHWSIL